MKNSVKVSLMLAGAAVMLTASACSSGGTTVSSGSSAAPAASAASGAKVAAVAAKRADKHLAKGQLAKALIHAEAAVAASPTDPAMRLRLGQVYLASGRFLSAERSYMDAVELGGATPRNVISLALARIALGKVDSARTLLDTYRADLPASDYGLALALSGDEANSVAVLIDAIRSADSNARTRQNLAMAYAFAGNWNGARIMAAQDLAQPEVDRRIAQWAMIARPGAYLERVAAVLNVIPQTDPGQPARLALVTVAKPMASAADLIPIPTPMTEPSLAPVGPAPVAGARDEFKVVPVSLPSSDARKAPAETPPARTALPVVTAATGDAPLIREPGGPLKLGAIKLVLPALAATKDAPLRATTAPVAVKAAPSRPVKLAMAGNALPLVVRSLAAGTHLVQLGAYSNPENARAAWKMLTVRYRDLANFRSASSTVTVKGRTLYRLSAVGFGNKATADAFCGQIRSQRGGCIVRTWNGKADPLRGNRLAAR